MQHCNVLLLDFQLLQHGFWLYEKHYWVTHTKLIRIFPVMCTFVITSISTYLNAKYFACKTYFFISLCFHAVVTIEAGATASDKTTPYVCD